MNVSRGVALAQNVRPNTDHPFTATTVPAGGTLQVFAGIVIALPPPARDSISINVAVALGDGRTAVGSVPLVISAE
jgi:hypothetical protein